jgi:DNA-directed RNA polymerase subunit N (RpoN/RPB10)
MTSTLAVSNIKDENITQPQRRSLQEFGYDKMTLLPVRCFTCNRVIANKQQKYETLLSNGYSIKGALDEMEIKSSCCRDKFMNPPKLPASLVLESSNSQITELYNSFQTANFENKTNNPYFNPAPLDPNKPRPSRTYYLSKPNMRMNDVQRRRIADIEKLTNEGPSVPNFSVANFTTDLETAFDELNLNIIPETKEAIISKVTLKPSDLYYIRQRIDSLDLGAHPEISRPKAQREFANIIDRLLLNLVNYNTGYEKAKEEMLQQKLDSVIIDLVRDIIETYKRNNSKLPRDERFTLVYNLLNQKYPEISQLQKQDTALRYIGLGLHGQQWRLDPKILDRIKATGIDTEAFASPLNSSFSKYYSLFLEDATFGSLGNFFSVAHPSSEKLYANPPFVPQILENIVPIMAQINTAVVITPTWITPPANWYLELAKVGYTANVYSDITYWDNGTEFTPRFHTTIWTKNVNINDIMTGMKGTPVKSIFQ